MPGRILYIDMDNVLVDFEYAVRLLASEQRAAFAGRFDEVPGIFALMPPIPGAVEAYGVLAEHFDTYILSTAPWDNPSAWSDKLLWVKRYLGERARKRLILSHHKHLARGDFLIDDRTKNGADRFDGELVQFGQEPFTDWPSVVAYLLPFA
jgi:5'(3')-deoxyribonucleotidase